MVPAVRPLGPLSMARGCARIDSRPDKAKIGSADRVEVHHARLLAVIGVRKTFPHGLDPYATLAAINSFKVRGIDFNLRRSLVFARDTGINDGLRLRRRVAPESTRSTHRVTSPFPGSLPLKTLHIHRPADLPDVYAGIGSGSRPYYGSFYALPV